MEKLKRLFEIFKEYILGLFIMNKLKRLTGIFKEYALELIILVITITGIYFLGNFLKIPIQFTVSLIAGIIALFGVYFGNELHIKIENRKEKKELINNLQQEYAIALFNLDVAHILFTSYKVQQKEKKLYFTPYICGFKAHNFKTMVYVNDCIKDENKYKEHMPEGVLAAMVKLHILEKTIENIRLTIQKHIDLGNIEKYENCWEIAKNNIYNAYIMCGRLIRWVAHTISKENANINYLESLPKLNIFKTYVELEAMKEQKSL